MSTFSNLLRPALVVTLVTTAGCSGGMINTRPDGPRGFLRIDSEPPSVQVEIDEKYSGVADGWADSTIPVEPGLRRVTLSAEGYITQRFDIEVAPYEHVTLELRLEPVLDLPDAPEEVNPLTPRRPGLRRGNTRASR